MRKTLVMIPAFGCGREMYDDVAAALGSGVKSVIHVAEQDRFETMAEGLLHAVPGHFTVLGTSMGGRLALEVALAAPERVESLVVIGASAGGVADPAAGLRRSARLRGGELEGVLSEMGDMVSHLPGPRGKATRDAFITMCGRWGRRRWRDNPMRWRTARTAGHGWPESPARRFACGARMTSSRPRRRDSDLPRRCSMDAMLSFPIAGTSRRWNIPPRPR